MRTYTDKSRYMVRKNAPFTPAVIAYGVCLFVGPFGRIMPYNEETLREIADYCGMVQYTKMVARHIHAAYIPSYILYDADNGEIRGYDGKNQFLNDFGDAMCEEYENQVPTIDTEE